MEVAHGNEDEEAEAEKRKGKEKIDCPVPEKEDAIVLGNDGGVLEDPVVVGEEDGMLVDGMSPQELDAFLKEASTERKVSGVGTGAAVLGGVAGMVVLGPLGAVAGAGVLAYAATREDKVGETARSGGEAVVNFAQKAKELDSQHVGVATGVSTAYQSARGSVAGQILTAKAKETAQPLLEKAKLAGSNMVEKWKSFDEQNQVSQNAVAAAGKTKEAAKEALTKVTSLDEKYQVSTKLQSGLTSGFNALSGMVRRAGATGAPGAGGAVVGKEGL